MSTTASKTQLTSLFDNRTLSRLERMRLNPHRRLTNRSRGEHLSGKGGSSTDFVDYRNYVPGDDMRYVDWNIFARLNKPYLKQFQHEEEMHVVIIIDASTSMVFHDKLLRAKQLAAAFGVMGLLNVERVSIYGCHHQGGKPMLMPPCTGRNSMKRMFEFLETLEGGGNSPIEEAVQTVLRLHRGRGVAVVLSDFLTFGDTHKSLNMLFSGGLEIYGAQILSPEELNPEITGDVRFVDCESSHTLDVSSAGDLLGIYHEHRQALADELSLACRKRNGRFVSISSAEPLEGILFDTLCRQGWVQR